MVKPLVDIFLQVCHYPSAPPMMNVRLSAFRLHAACPNKTASGVASVLLPVVF